MDLIWENKIKFCRTKGPLNKRRQKVSVEGRGIQELEQRKLKERTLFWQGGK